MGIIIFYGQRKEENTNNDESLSMLQVCGRLTKRNKQKNGKDTWNYNSNGLRTLKYDMKTE